MLRFLTAGESHGPGLVTIVEGLPAGIPVSADGLAKELARRRMGFGRGKRMDVEEDRFELLGGIRNGLTLGSPVAVAIRNTEWPLWQEIMDPAPGAKGARISRPRPGHADLPGMLKYDTDDARDILERSSARETAARTVAGYLGRLLLNEANVSILSHVTAIGEVEYIGPSPTPDLIQVIDDSPVRCVDPATSTAMVAVIEEAASNRDTVGGVFEIVAHGVPVGIGSHVHYDRRLDAELARAVMSIPAVKGVEIGEAFRVAHALGSAAHDEIAAGPLGLRRLSNRAGGLEGGISNGEPLLVRAAMKPLSTLMQPLRTVDLDTGEEAQAVRERSDVCAVPAAAVVGEQMVAFVLATEFLRKFGGDTIADFRASHQAYVTRLESRVQM